MTSIHAALVLLVLYGDLTKRVMGAQASLFLLYGVAALMLMAMVIVGRGRAGRVTLSAGDSALNHLALILITVYLVQGVASVLFSGTMKGLVHAVYVSLPLAYIVVVQRHCPRFDIGRVAAIFLVLCIPVNIVGAVQYFVDPGFLVSVRYAGPDGGVISRTFMTTGTFSRYPSIFSSADRYSAMALFQFFFAFVAMPSRDRLRWWRIIWIGFNAVTGAYALLIAGARSRILVAGVAVGLMAVVALIRLTRSQRLQAVSMAVKVIAAVAILGGTAYVVASSSARGDGHERGLFPVVALLRETAEEGEMTGRVEGAVDSTMIPEETTLFGRGLGTIGEGGKPGEFGVYSMWHESGLVWGSLLLFGFLGIVAVLAGHTWRATIATQPVHVFVCCVPLLLLVFSLLAGLTSAFELSSGILLGACIGAIARARQGEGVPSAIRNGSVVDGESRAAT